MTKGHNNPPDPIDEAIAPFGDAISEAENWLDGTLVESEDQMKAVDALSKEIKAAKKAVSDAEESEAKPIYDQWKATKARFKPTLDDLDRIAKGLAAIVDPFKRKLAAEKEEAAKQARIEAARKAREAEEAARAAQAGDIEAAREAALAAAAADQARRLATVASSDTVKGLRLTHFHEITDYRAALHWIARHDKDAVTAFVEDYVRRNFKDAEIDGVRKWSERVAV